MVMVMKRGHVACWRPAVILAGICIAATSAYAGQCPPGKMGVDVTKPSTLPAKDVTDKVLAAIDLGKEPAKIDGRMLRLRKLEIQPGRQKNQVATMVAMATVPRSSTSSRARSRNMPATAPCRSCTRAEMSRARPRQRRIGGRTPGSRP